MVLLTAAAYAAAGLLALVLAIPPSYASPLFPAAGVALVAVLLHGRSALVGVALGVLVITLYLAEPRAQSPQLVWLLPLASSLGACGQAALGAWLVRRWVKQPLLLAELTDVVWFFLGGAVIACVLNASVTMSVLVWAGVVPVAEWSKAWSTWWIGDVLGVLIGAPITLALIGRPRADWAPRLLTLALPLAVTTALLGVGTALVSHWDEQRSRNVFERDAAMAGAALEARLSQAKAALQAVNGLFVASDDVTATEFELGSRPWLQQDQALQALGFGQRLSREEVPLFESWVNREDGRNLKVFDRPAPSGQTDLPPAPYMVVVRHIEPPNSNEAARGVNSMSVPAARSAIEQSLATGRPVLTAPFVLTQLPNEPTGAVMYLAMNEGMAPPATQGRVAFRGVVFVTLRPNRMVDAAKLGAASYLQWCLIDTQAPPLTGVLAGPAGCGTVNEPRALTWLVHRQSYMVGERQWQLVLRADPAAIPVVGRSNAWLFATVGLCSAAVLSALLLTVTGRTRRIEAAVAERTTDLQREVIERERTAGALLASKQRLRSIFDHAPAGIVFAGLDYRVEEVNPRMCALLGQEADWLANRDLLATAMPADRSALVEALKPLVQGQVTSVQRQARLYHRDGTGRWVDTRWSMLRGSQGQPLWLVAVVEDITERLKREEAEQGRQVAESANRAKNEFLSRMSHELRTPLNAMLGFAQLLELDRRPPLASHQAGWTAQILQAGWHLLEMINDTLDLSRIEAGVVELQTRPLALAPLLAQCTALVAQAAAARQVQLQVQLGADAAAVMGDETRLKQVLTNLLSNAVKYNAEGGQVVVGSHRTADGQIALWVRDTGPGLQPDQLAQLFQPFNRLGQERGSTEGTGIGLVISRRLAELMGGTLRAESMPGQGATFVLELPAAEPGQVLVAASLPASAPASAYRRRQVLYVEDNETNVEVMRGILMQRPQVALRVCGTGLAGLAAAVAHPPDLLLLDMHLPDLDGLELLARLQADPVTGRIPVLAVSADATPARIQAALDAGAKAYQTKPINLPEFLAALDDLLDAVETQAAPL